MGIDKLPVNYMRSKSASLEMANSIEKYWHRRGYPHVRVWVEESMGPKGNRDYYIRSNIVFGVPVNAS